MAISQNFLTGRMRKSAGGTRFSTWRGLNIVASKPIDVRQNVTAAVTLNRRKLSVIGKGVSKLNAYVKMYYSLGIQKTTPFADTVKFFRNRIKDDLKLDPALLKDSKFGTGNAESQQYEMVGDALSAFEIEPFALNPIWNHASYQVDVIVFNDTFTKVVNINQSVSYDDVISINLLAYGFVAGDKVYFGTRPKITSPGTDLTGTVKMTNSSSFCTLT